MPALEARGMVSAGFVTESNMEQELRWLGHRLPNGPFLTMTFRTKGDYVITDCGT